MGFNDLSSYHIAACHRLANRKGAKTLPVIIRFINRKHAFDIRRGKHMMQIKLMPFPDLYITENLVAPRRTVYNVLRKLKQRNIIKELWTYNGTIYFRDNHDNQEKHSDAGRLQQTLYN